MGANIGKEGVVLAWVLFVGNGAEAWGRESGTNEADVGAVPTVPLLRISGCCLSAPESFPLYLAFGRVLEVAGGFAARGIGSEISSISSPSAIIVVDVAAGDGDGARETGRGRAEGSLLLDDADGGAVAAALDALAEPVYTPSSSSSSSSSSSKTDSPGKDTALVEGDGVGASATACTVASGPCKLLFTLLVDVSPGPDVDVDAFGALLEVGGPRPTRVPEPERSYVMSMWLSRRSRLNVYVTAERFVSS